MNGSPYARQKYLTLESALRGDVGTWIKLTKGREKYAVVNPDIDGLLSYSILKVFDPSIKFGGYYVDEYQLLLTREAEEVRLTDRESGFPASSFLSVENDLLVMDSIGQHFCLLDNAKFANINPNVLRFGTGSPETRLHVLKDSFGKKYPLSTAFFLWTILLARPGENFSDEQLIGLLYPDSAIVKAFGVKYKNNVLSWFEWMGHSDLGDQFYRLQASPNVLQIARCFYRKLGVAQPSVGFDGLPDQPRVNNKISIQIALDYFCRLLNIESQDIFDGALICERPYSYKRIVAARQDDLRERQKIFSTWLEGNIVGNTHVRSTNDDGACVNQRVVSEAVTTYGEWSVTTHGVWTPLTSAGIETKDKVVRGRNNELQNHIDQLGLDNPCLKSSRFGCPYTLGNESCPD